MSWSKRGYYQWLLFAPDSRFLVPPQTGTVMRKSQPTDTKLRATSSDKEAFYILSLAEGRDFNLYYSEAVGNQVQSWI